MIHTNRRLLFALSSILIAFSCANPPAKEEKSTPTPPLTRLTTYDQLATLFKEWREFHSPQMIEGVPDYGEKAMKKQQSNLAEWQDHLNSFDTTGWPVKHQIDWYLVWAEMNSLDFDHRVRQPWANDPGFYVWFYPSMPDVPEREGPNIFGAIELPAYQWPLSQGDAAEIVASLRKATDVFQQARINLTGNKKDLWVTGTRSIREQADDLESFAAGVVGTFPDLATAARSARDASNKFADWLTIHAPSRRGPSGVGKENYTWYLHNVHLVPFSWEGEKLILERELARAHSGLRFTEHRNRKLPKLFKKNTPEDYQQMLNKGVSEYMEFLDKEDFLTVKAYMEPAMRAQIRSFVPSEGLRGFFDEIDYRDPMPLRAHQYHWIELARNREEPNESPIRRIPLLDNIFDGRAEGMATALEELVMNAGLLKDRPRATELVYIMLAQRAARGLGGLYQHGLEMNFDQATQFASKWVPWGLLPADGGTIQHEEQFYLQQPVYGSSYIMGKVQIDQLIAEYSRQREGKFQLKEFMDEFNRVGIIPVSLVYWQMTGDKSMLNRAIGKN